MQRVKLLNACVRASPDCILGARMPNDHRRINKIRRRRQLLVERKKLRAAHQTTAPTTHVKTNSEKLCRGPSHKAAVLRREEYMMLALARKAMAAHSHNESTKRPEPATNLSSIDFISPAYVSWSAHSCERRNASRKI